MERITLSFRKGNKAYFIRWRHHLIPIFYAHQLFLLSFIEMLLYSYVVFDNKMLTVIYFLISTTSNARLRTHLALSRRKFISELSANYLLIQLQNTYLRFQLLDTDYLCSNFITNPFFVKTFPLCKKLNRKKILKNWSQIGTPGPR